MAKAPKQHTQVGADYLATAEQGSVRHSFPFPAKLVWNALLDPVAWTEWLPITKVTWYGEPPFQAGTTRTVMIGDMAVEETFFIWEEGKRMAFRFERSPFPISAAVEDYIVVDKGETCEMHWSGKASGVPLGFLVSGRLKKGLEEGMPKLEALIAKDPARFS